MLLEIIKKKDITDICSSCVVRLDLSSKCVEKWKRSKEWKENGNENVAKYWDGRKIKKKRNYSEYQFLLLFKFIFKL